MVESTAIGIDLGTTYSCVGVYKNNQIQILQENGERTFPSIISFVKSDILLGFTAKNQMYKNLENTIYDAKRLIGRNFNDKEVQEDKKFWTFNLKRNKKEKPVVMVKINEEEKGLFPENISGIILKELKKRAEEYLGREVKEAVITVPAYFNNNQRQSTIDAGKNAGFNKIKLINEPTAAAIAYGIENESNKERKICVFDFGGGTFDVTIIKVKGNTFIIKATGGDTHLGGQDIDNLLVEYCIQEFKDETGIDISNNKKAIVRLKNECEKKKKFLSAADEVEISVDSISKGDDLSVNIDRDNFENLCKDIFEKCMKKLKQIIEESGFKKEEIDEVVLVGGSSRIPKIQEMIKEYFGGESKLILSKTINADEAVAYGAAIVACGNSYLNDDNDFNLNIKDVIPLTLGVGSKDNMIPMIKKNTNVPFKKVKTFHTIKDNQTDFGIGIYEGEEKLVKDNILLDTFYLRNITKAPKGETKMEITFDVDENGILNVTAKEKGNNNEKKIKVERGNEEIDNLINEQIKFINGKYSKKGQSLKYLKN